MLDLKQKDALKKAVKSVFDKVNVELKKLGLDAWDERRLTRQEGGMGYVPGEKVTLTDEVGMADVLDNDTNKVIAKYPAVKLSNGAWFSLKHLVKPSLAGYSFTGKFVEDLDGNGKIVGDQAQGGILRVADVDPKFNPADADQFFDFGTRNLLEIYVLIKEGNESVDGIELTFRGTACRPIVAKKKSPLPSMPYKVGANRVMRQQIWTK